MDIWHIKCFLAVADTHSFSRASELLFTSQPAISQNIALLEQEVEAKLFDRSKRQVVLTDVGATLYHDAADLIKRYDNMVMQARKARGPAEASRFLRVGYEKNIAGAKAFRIFLTDAMEKTRAEEGELVVTVTSVDDNDPFKPLKNGVIDVLLTFRIKDDKAGICHYASTAYAEKLLLYYREDESTKGLDLKDIITKKGVIIIENHEEGMSTIHGALYSLGIQPDIQVCKDINDAILAVEMGVKVSFFLESVADRMARDDIICVEIGLPARHVQVVHRNGEESDAVKTFVRAIAISREPR